MHLEVAKRIVQAVRDNAQYVALMDHDKHVVDGEFTARELRAIALVATDKEAQTS